MTVALYDLAEIRREARDRRRREREEAENPATPLQEVMRAVAEKQLTKSTMSMDTLQQLDTVLTATERLAFDWPQDALRIADGLLLALLRLSWVRASGKPLSDPEPSRTAMKLFQLNVIDKTTLKRITSSLKSSNAVHKLDTCRGLLALISA